MKFNRPVPIKEIAAWIDATLIGDPTLNATGINEIHKVEKGDITFVDVEKYFRKSIDSKASIIILNKYTECPDGKALLLCEKPFLAYDSIVRRMRTPLIWNEIPKVNQSISPDATIEPNVMIGNHVEIGAGSYLQAGTIIRDHVSIGKNVTIQSGAIIGTDAFYLKKWDSHYQSWTTGGKVVIENEVQIGAGCTINSGVSGDTVVGEGTKIDCQVQIGHGVVIGKHGLIAAQVGIAGKTIIGDHCVIYGQVGIAQNLVIGNHVTILAKSGVGENIADGKIYFGIPAMEAKLKKRELVVLKQLSEGWHSFKSVFRKDS
jgi:UDP-3-O-[3-hydroxymyristoyl] glucosamine N-acyltransferase